MTDKSHIRKLIGYMIWADEQMCAAAGALSDEEYHREQGISLGSVHKLLVHGMAAQWLWLLRWKNEPPIKIETEALYPTRESLTRRWPHVHAALLGFLEEQTESTLAVIVSYRNSRGEAMSLPLGILMVYLVDHATYHRGQINSMIKRAGGKPWGGSMYMYMIEQEGK